MHAGIYPEKDTHRHGRRVLFGVFVAVMLIFGLRGQGMTVSPVRADTPTCETGTTFDTTQNLCVSDAQLIAVEDTPVDTCPSDAAQKVIDTACVSDIAVVAAPDEPTPTVTPTTEPEIASETDAGSVVSDQASSDSSNSVVADSSPAASFAKPGDNGGGNQPPPVAASLTITVWQCLAPAFDPGNLEVIDVSGVAEKTASFTQCTPDLANVQFTIGTVSGVAIEKQAWSIGNPARANFPSMYLGQDYITQQVPYNFTNGPVVICRSNLVSDQRFEPGTPTVQWNFQQNENVTCDWYTYQAAAPGKIVIHMFECHSDTLNANDLAAVRAACVEDFNGYPFYVTPTVTGVKVNGGTSGNGIAEFDGLLPGMYQVAQYDEGSFRFPAVYCRQSAPGEPSPLGLHLQTMIDAKGTTISATLNGNSTIFCEWYVNKAGFTRGVTGVGSVIGDLPDVVLQPAVVDNDDEAPATGSVVINLHGCPVGFSAKGANLTTLGTQCVDALTGVVFTMTATGAKPQTAATSGDFASIVSFDGVPAGSVAVSVALPDGYAGSQVYCGGGNSGISRAGSSGGKIIMSSPGTIQVSVPAGEAVLCDWYAIPG